MENGNRAEIIMSKKNVKKVRVIWIDDDTKRSGVKEVLNNNEKLDLEIIHPVNFELKNYREKADIFLVDYHLDRIPELTKGKYSKDQGFSFSGKIRDTFLEYPIYGTSEDTKSKDGMFGEKKKILSDMYFDKIVKINELIKTNGDILYYDALDFEKIRKCDFKIMKDVFKLINAPMKIEGHLDLVFPAEIRNEIYDFKTKVFYIRNVLKRIFPQKLSSTNENNTIIFSNWLLDEFLVTPGFLYNKLYAATYLGVDVDYFDKIESYFEDAKYKGLFYRYTEPLWWKAKLSEIVFKNPESQKLMEINPWEIVPIVYNIEEEYRSKCVVCKKQFPETIGFKKGNREIRRPVHYNCSYLHPTIKSIAYYDQPREFI